MQSEHSVGCNVFGGALKHSVNANVYMCSDAWCSVRMLGTYGNRQAQGHLLPHDGEVNSSDACSLMSIRLNISLLSLSSVPVDPGT
jgi:hypothetical protein